MPNNNRPTISICLAVSLAVLMLTVFIGDACTGGEVQGLLPSAAVSTSPPEATAQPTTETPQQHTPSPTAPPSPTPVASPTPPPLAKVTGFRGIWVASVWNLDYPSRPGLPVDNLKEEAIHTLESAKDLGFTAVILQVRPSADSLYDSDIFPWSGFISESQGLAPADGFDPLAFWVEEAHARDLELHAWVNPFRVTVLGTKDNPLYDLTDLALDNPARQNPSWVRLHSDGNMYFDPGIPEVRDLIIRGVSELVSRYDIDGVQFDDYFYPGPDFDDAETFEANGAGFAFIGDWRRDCINRLIRDTGKAIDSIRPDCRFGVSPTGIWANRSPLNPLGSDTFGYEGYHSTFADSRLWVKSGWIDYVCPQLYWQVGHQGSDYETLLHWWADVTQGTSVDLYIGQAAYRVGEGADPGSPWHDESELLRQWALNDEEAEAAGVILFRFGSVSSNQSLASAVKDAFAG